MDRCDAVTRGHGRDRGQAVLMLLPVMAVAALLGIGVALAGRVVVDRSRAQAAADAAALAGVGGGRRAAAELAAANGGALVEFRSLGDDHTVEVVVAVGGVRARARATDGP